MVDNLNRFIEAPLYVAGRGFDPGEGYIIESDGIEVARTTLSIKDDEFVLTEEDKQIALMLTLAPYAPLLIQVCAQMVSATTTEEATVAHETARTVLALVQATEEVRRGQL